MITNSPEEADVVIQKLSSDMGIHRNPRKGTLKAPEVILGDLEFEETVFIDEVFPDEFSLERTHNRILENTAELAGYNKPVISIGGDHSVSYPVIKALKEENPEMKLIWLDAHLDVKEKVSSHVSHDVPVRELVEEGVFEPEEVYFVGITRIDADEEEYIEDKNFHVYQAEEVDSFLREFSFDEQPVYLSLDIDVLEDVQGTGYPDGALSVEKTREIVQRCKILHGDLVEVAPPFDKGETVEKARELLQTLAASGKN